MADAAVAGGAAANDATLEYLLTLDYEQLTRALEDPAHASVCYANEDAIFASLLLREFGVQSVREYVDAYAALHVELGFTAARARRTARCEASAVSGDDPARPLVLFTNLYGLRRQQQRMLGTLCQCSADELDRACRTSADVRRFCAKHGVVGNREQLCQGGRCGFRVAAALSTAWRAWRCGRPGRRVADHNPLLPAPLQVRADA